MKIKKLPFQKKVKALNKSTEKEKARKMFKLYIRLRDCLATTGTLLQGKCYTCGKMCRMGTSEWQAGHYKQGSHESTYFIEENVHGQCVGCNKFLHANLAKYTIAMIKEYGEGLVNKLTFDNGTTVKRTAQDYRDIYNKYKEKIEYIENL